MEYEPKIRELPLPLPCSLVQHRSNYLDQPATQRPTRTPSAGQLPAKDGRSSCQSSALAPTLKNRRITNQPQNRYH